MHSLSDSALVEVIGLEKHFDISPPFLNRVIEKKGKAYVKAVDGVDFRIKKGETFSLVGESGCGKSTMGNLMVGLYSPTRGTIKYDGVNLENVVSRKEVRDIRSRMQMIFQDPYASLNPRWRVSRIIAEPIRFAEKRGSSNLAIEQRVRELLLQVGLGVEDGRKYPHEFSGGQRQRISIARALAGRPDFIVCDEPTSALDVSVQAQILNLMKDLQREYGLTYLFISHDLAVVKFISTTVGVLYLGRLVELTTTKTLFGSPRHPYTRMLLNAIPDLTMTGRKRLAVAGEVPSPIAPPSGCSFHPRCPHASERCRIDRPLIAKIKDTWVACHAVEEGLI